MVVEEHESFGLDAILGQAERIASSRTLHGSDALCKLLRFLARQSIEQPGETIKEHQIATQVFGKNDDFDPRIDASIRVQVGRLRSKLIEYYATEGAGDHLILEIPKGAYSLGLHTRIGHDTPSRTVLNQNGKSLLARWRVLVSASALGILMLCAGLAFWFRASPPSNSLLDRDSALYRFWRPFHETKNPALVVFSNALFVGRPDTGLRYFDPQRDLATNILDHYTGIGEVFAIFQLDRLFHSFDSTLVLKRGQLLNWDDTQDRSIIFVGAPSENLRVRDLAWEQEFAFRFRDDKGTPRFIYIEDLRTDSGKPHQYFSSQTNPLQEDYAVVSLQRAPNRQQWMMLLAGTTTLGTQAAAEFVCNRNSIESLQSQLKFDSTIPFACLIRVHIKGGVPVASELVKTRRTKN